MEPSCCWICLQEDGTKLQPCGCPRVVHKDCLAYWQLHSAGTLEEHTCRFCAEPLPDWKQVLGGNCHVEQVPVVAVVFEGCEWRLKVPPTPEGALRFQRQIELITGLPFNEQVHIRFFCKSPKGQDLSLSGTRCLEAAIHCAAIHCAHQKHHTSQQQPSLATDHVMLQPPQQPCPRDPLQQQLQQASEQQQAAPELQQAGTEQQQRQAGAEQQQQHPLAVTREQTESPQPQTQVESRVQPVQLQQQNAKTTGNAMQLALRRLTKSFSIRLMRNGLFSAGTFSLAAGSPGAFAARQEQQNSSSEAPHTAALATLAASGAGLLLC